jgi:hypothetical protein
VNIDLRININKRMLGFKWKTTSNWSPFALLGFAVLSLVLILLVIESKWFYSNTSICPPCFFSLGSLQIPESSDTWWTDDIPRTVHIIAKEPNYSKCHKLLVNSINNHFGDSWNVQEWSIAGNLEIFVQKKYPVYYSMYKDLSRENKAMIAKYLLLYDSGGVIIHEGLLPSTNISPIITGGKVQLVSPSQESIILSPARHPFWHWVLFEALSFLAAVKCTESHLSIESFPVTDRLITFVADAMSAAPSNMFQVATGQLLPSDNSSAIFIDGKKYFQICES